MPLNDPFENQMQVSPVVGQAEKKAAASGLTDPFERESVTIPSEAPAQTQYVPSSQEQTQFAPQNIQADYLLDKVKQTIADKSGLSTFSLERAMSWDNVKPAILAAGGMVGGAIGATATGPETLGLGAPAGILAGSVLGTGIAQSFINTVERRGLQDGVSSIAKEMRDDALFTGGAVAIGPAFKLLGPSVGKIFGLDDTGIKQVIKDAERNKVPFALQDVVGESSRKSGKLVPTAAAAWPKVIGVFPFIGGPQKTAYKATTKALGESIDTTLNAIAPNATLNNLGIDVVTAAKNSNKQFKGIASGLYEHFYKIADDLGQPAIIPTKPIKKAIDMLQSMKNRPMVEGAGGVKKPLKQPKIAADFDKYVNELRNIGDSISPAEFRSIEEDLNRFSSAANIKGYDEKQLSTLKQSLEVAQQSIDFTKIEDTAKATELQGALDTANRWYAAGMALFSSPAGKKFTKVDKNIFNSKFFQAGGITADQFGKEIVKSSSSPQMIQDFRNIVGQKQMANVARHVVDDAVSSSVRNGTLDFSTFERNLKLDSNTGRETMDELFRNTGISREKIQSLINVGKVHGKVELADASNFVSRRLVLGGLGTTSMITGAVLAPIKFTTVVVPSVLMIRGGSKFLADPKVLRWMTTAMDDTVADKIRRVAASNLFDQYIRYQNTSKPTDEGGSRADKEQQIGNRYKQGESIQ